ncbi:hypothetical protein HanRHA438_Chr10g0446411 [Helianthus annuus]|nr:hypothetical protein HanRHA438_Chr10g0446411 [Helianthus annuus]
MHSRRINHNIPTDFPQKTLCPITSYHIRRHRTYGNRKHQTPKRRIMVQRIERIRRHHRSLRKRNLRGMLIKPNIKGFKIRLPSKVKNRINIRQPVRNPLLDKLLSTKDFSIILLMLDFTHIFQRQSSRPNRPLTKMNIRINNRPIRILMSILQHNLLSSTLTNQLNIKMLPNIPINHLPPIISIEYLLRTVLDRKQIPNILPNIRIIRQQINNPKP